MRTSPMAHNRVAQAVVRRGRNNLPLLKHHQAYLITGE